MLIYGVTLGLIAAAIQFGQTYATARVPDETMLSYGPESVQPWARIDGRYYAQIARDGYASDSLTAFFPLYPLVGHALSRLGLSSVTALLIVSHISLSALLVFLVRYLNVRRLQTPQIDPSLVATLLALWPCSFYLRMAYTESLFLCLTLLALDRLERRQIWSAACLAGLAAATRPVGIALLLPLMWSLWRQTPRRWRLLWQIPALAIVGASGLWVYCAYLGWRFGNPFQFEQAQFDYVHRLNPPWPQHLWSLLTFEPVWSVYFPHSEYHWQQTPQQGIGIFSLRFMNPILMVSTWGLVAYGAWRRWLTTNEVLLSIGLLAIPYVSHSCRGLMIAQGRYAFVAFPAFITLGCLLSSAPRFMTALWCGLSAALLAAWTVLYSQGYELV